MEQGWVLAFGSCGGWERDTPCKALSFALMRIMSMGWIHQPERPGCHKDFKSPVHQSRLQPPSETAW